MEYGNIMNVETSGASSKTAIAYGNGLTGALIAAVASRESRGGAAISGTKGLGDNGNGYGLMQVDKRWHQPGGAWDSEAHVDQATKILVDFVPVVQKKFPSWSREKQLKGALAAYNMGEGVLDNADVGPYYHRQRLLR
ncbi:unnamed protein product [Gadus morhua 'NCC']